MKIADHINRLINEYPSLYMLEDYKKSTFAVLHHCFIVLGNGIEWAQTGNSKTGGYLTDPQFKKVDDEWVRVEDKPYGYETHDLDPRAFKEEIFYFYEIDADSVSEYRIVFESQLRRLKKINKVCHEFDYNSGKEDGYTHRYHKVDINHSSGESPYPNFSKRHSCFWKIDPSLIQEDWRTAAVEHLIYWQNYFSDNERIKSYHYYEDPKSLKKWITEHYKDLPGKYPDWVQSVRDGYEVQEFDGTNFELLASVRWEKELQKTKTFLSDTLERLII